MLDFGLTFWDLLSTMFTFFFGLWPVLLVSMLDTGGRSLLATGIAGWIFLAIGRVYLVFKPSSVFTFRLLPEPWNTALFVVAGAALLGFKYGLRALRWGRSNRKMGQARAVDDLLDLSPREFEEMVVQLYRRKGHEAVRTGRPGDHGVDIVIEAGNGRKWIVQCKRWRGAVGEPVIRDFYGVLHHEKADAGAIVTTGTFTLQAREWARGKPIYLYDGREFLELWKRAAPRS
jgi:HJR/Mrr/RecB family endonuclease